LELSTGAGFAGANFGARTGLGAGDGANFGTSTNDGLAVLPLKKVQALASASVLALDVV